MANTTEEVQNKITQALMWLGFEDVEFEKRFSTKKFENGEQGEFVYETNISYSAKGDMLPTKVADNIIMILEKVVDYHANKNRVEDQKKKLEAQFQKESEL